MTKRLLSLILLALAAISYAAAQNVVRGIVVDADNGEHLSFVNVRLTAPGNERRVIATAATDDKGAFSIKGVKNGAYDVIVTYVGYKTARLSATLSKSAPTADLGTIRMATLTSSLGEATVTGQKTAIKLEVDRKSYDVSQDLANVGASASDALENIPSVQVDQDGNISMRGSSSVEVWINGKPSGLTADNRAMILQQMPAETIERIEVIDNPSAKYSAEGSAGIINIVLKHDRKAGYYGSLQAGGNTAGGANASGNISYNSKWVDVNATVGYRHHQDKSGSRIDQDFLDPATGLPTSYQRSEAENENRGNNIFTRAGVIVHATKKDDFTLNGNMMLGRGTEEGSTPYFYGSYLTDGTETPTKTLWRSTSGKRPMRMLNGEFDYRHTFSEKHYIDLNVTRGQWKSDMENTYRDVTYPGFVPDGTPLIGGVFAYDQNYQRTEQHIKNNFTAVKLDYENAFGEHWTLQTGYNGDFHRENTPQVMFTDPTNFDGTHEIVDQSYYNRFIYNNDVHALYATATMKYGKWGLMAGLRGEYWTVHTESYGFTQDPENDYNKLSSKPLDPAPAAYEKSFFELFPSLFLSYQLTENDQLQVNYTRRLRRPWGGELNTFMDTRSATNLNFGNPELTPEFSNSFALNYLRTMAGGNHSFLLSAYYRPTSDVMQRLSYRLPADAKDAEGNLINESRLLSTSQNITRSTNTGGELTLKDRFGTWFDLNTTASAYYYHLNAFDYDITDPLYHQTVHVNGNSESRFTWSIRMQANVRLPYDWSLQGTGSYRSREAVSQGYRNPSYGLDLGVRKFFLHKKLMLSVNCRDVLNSRRFTQNSVTPTFTQHGEFWRHSRKVGFTLTWNFGNMQRKPRPDQMRQGQGDMNGGADDGFGGGSGYGMDMGE